MLKNKLNRILEKAVTEAQEKGLLPPVALPEITVEHPQDSQHGDYASSLPLKLAKAGRLNPMNVARSLESLLPPIDEVEKVTVAPPGFLNFKLKPSWLVEQVDSISSGGFGKLELGKGTKVQIEFVSVNPTGPLHVGHGRGAVLGSTLANVLETAGYSVTKEYYVNDAGTQMDIFYRSLYARYCQAQGKEAELPPNGYQGQYLIELAREIVTEKGDVYLNMPPGEATTQLGQVGLEKMLDAIKTDLDRLGVDFDVWFSERTLFDRHEYQHAMELLRTRGFVAEKEGAQWFVSSSLGEDKDNVLVRSTGAPTYFASDVAYHHNKFVERGFERVINIWGADHQGHVSRMKAVMGALGIDPQRLTIIIAQMVTLRREGELVRASKRTGEMVTLRELMDEVGPDVCRFFFLSRAADSQMDFDLDLAKQQSQDNPVYYVQYAHARIASILRLAGEKCIDYSKGDLALLTSEAELALIRKMLALPELIELVAETLEPHHLPYFAQDLATEFHAFYKQCRVVSDDEPLTCARLKLVMASQVVLAETLRLMGMTAPERM